MSQNLRNITRAIYVFDAVARRMPDDAWSNASPCEGWTALDVLKHQCGVLDALAHIAETGELQMPAMIEEDVTDPGGRWGQTRDRVLAALDTQGALHHDGQWWFGPMTVDGLIAVVMWDPLTHAWDLAQAAGIEAHLPADLAELSHERISAMHETALKWKLVGEPVDIGDLGDADPVARYLALVGRDPR